MVMSTCDKLCLPSLRRKKRSMPRPMSATESAPDKSASGKLFVFKTVVSPTYPPRRKYEPWARLTIRMTPKTSDRPLPRRNSMAP